MLTNGVDPVQLTKIQEYTQKAIIQESHKQDPKQKQQDRVLNREQQVTEWGRTHMQELEESIKKLNTTAEAFNIRLRFKVDEETDRIVVKVVEKETEKVIREIPPEQVLNMVAQIQDLIGVLVDSRR